MNREIRMAVSLEVAGRQRRCVWTEVRIGDMADSGNCCAYGSEKAMTLLSGRTFGVAICMCDRGTCMREGTQTLIEG